MNWFKACALLGALCITACGSDDEGNEGSGGAGGAGGSAGSAGSAGTSGSSGSGGGACVPDSDATFAAQRDACTFQPGARAADTFGCRPPLPFEHVIIIMQENRSFDHYFQKLPEYGQPDVDVAPSGTTNPALDGTLVPHTHDTTYCFSDTNHEWHGSHEEWNDGANDGFAKANARGDDPTGSRAMTYYDETDIPFYYELANTFATSDRYFCALLGPTWPNRMYLYAGTSFGMTSNLPIGGTKPDVFGSMNTAGVTWKEYRSNLATSAMLLGHLTRDAAHLVPIAQFAQDVANGTLPQVVFLDAVQSADGAGESSEHPPGDMQVGQKWVYDQIKLIVDSQYWATSAIFVTYDEHGGLYDHVSPPTACKPDDTPPASGGDVGDFDRLGFRVPLLVVSPYAKAHYVSHETHSHTSILRFVETVFDLPALTRRDANADALLDLFDLENPPFMTPPTLHEPPVDQAKLDACLVQFPP